MKRLLLSVLFLLLSLASNAQATAYEVPDLNQCNYEIFDLTTQIPIALGNQDPENFTVTFFISEASAVANAPAITNTTAFVPNVWPTQTIFLRVTNTDTGEYDITSFTVAVTSGSTVGNFNDISVCDVYILPALGAGNYYTGPNGTGVIIPAGTAIMTTQTIYVYYSNGACSSEDSFMVTVSPVPVVPIMANVTACGSYTLPALANGTYTTGSNGTGSAYFAGTTITSSMVLYIYEMNDFGCFGQSQFTITITGNISNLILPNPVIACDTDMTGFAVFNLLSAQAEFEANNPNIPVTGFYLTQADAQAGVNAITFPEAYLNLTPGQQTIYLGAGTGGCIAALPFELVVLPCGTTSTLTGTVTLDADGNGCGTADGPAAGILVSYNFGNYVFNAYTDVNGNYMFTNVPEGVVTLWIQPINGQNFTSNPTSVTLNLPDDSTNNDFCLSVPQPFTDVAVYLSPYSQAVPGFTSYYAITVVNYGTQAASGTASFTYDAALLSNPVAWGGIISGNTISWTYANLAPYQSQTYYVHLTVNTPPTVVGGTQLIFSVAASVTGTDVNTDNNIQDYTQYAVNSFDPNDITVREGAYITEVQADDFLHYTVRFQNTGSANAQNVRVNLPLDANLDWSTFQPISASHLYHANRTAGVVDFMFDNIQLPFEDANEAASHGFVTFRIKPVADIQLGDSMSETANIYFDFNEAIVTNTATTTVGALNVKGFSKDGIALFPNPARATVTLQLSNATDAQVSVTDVLGKNVMSANVNGGSTVLDVTSLKTGVYFVTISAGNSATTKKLVIE
jgi:uncharacterized repeat protein (TIGR01451 family)